jgi:putative addiction module component (TIGR02574 family)
LSWEGRTGIFASVAITLDQIVEETRQLPTDVVAELVDRIWAARHGGMDPDIEQAWKREAQQRVAEIQNGQVEGIPGEEVSARIRKILGR